MDFARLVRDTRGFVPTFSYLTLVKLGICNHARHMDIFFFFSLVPSPRRSTCLIVGDFPRKCSVKTWLPALVGLHNARSNALL